MNNNEQLTLNSAIEALFDEEEQEILRHYLLKFLDSNDEFDKVGKDITVHSFDSVTFPEKFANYFKQYSNLEKDLLSQIKLEENSPWIRRVLDCKKIYFLVSDSRWKHKPFNNFAEIALVLIGQEKYPTIEINID